MAIRDAVVEAGVTRLRPILMTTGTTVFLHAATIGIGMKLMQPLAIAVVGGLALSTLLPLFDVPSEYIPVNGLSARSLAFLTGDARMPETAEAAGAGD